MTLTRITAITSVFYGSKLEWLSVGSDGKVVITADDSNIGSHYLEFIVTDSEGLTANLP